MSNETRQEDNIVGEGGQQAGRDINVFKLDPPSDGYDSQIQALIAKCEEEIEDDEVVDDVIEKLRDFEEYEDEKGRDLEEKLEMGGRNDRYRKAVRHKENFSKKKTSLQFVRSAQHLFALLLERIEYKYDYKVKPLIDRGEDKHVVDEAIHDYILDPIINELNGSSVIIGPSEIQGMMYYLTAKCLIDWHSE
jgi:hypothetical protein